MADKVTKEELSQVIVKKAGCSKAKAGEALNGLVDHVTKSLKKGKSVALTGFGTFSTVKRKARTGRNPQTGESIKIPGGKAVKFKVGKALKEAVKKK